MTEKLRILVIGAHPDDCDIYAGGVATLYRQGGHDVRFVSVTNGESGHHTLSGAELTSIRTAEAQAAGKLLGIQYDVLDFRDGYLQSTLEARFAIIRIIREYQPDLVLTHRPNDYHPDHRAVSQIVCDASYMVTVPPIVPEIPALRKDPVVAYLCDHFTRPYPFSPRVVVDIEPVLDSIIGLLDCHVSQFYEWLPYNQQIENDVPTDAAKRKEWLKQWYLQTIAFRAEQHKELIKATYGTKQGENIKYIEAFEPCEYGSPLSDDAVARLFPFLS